MNLFRSQIWTYDSLAQKPSLTSHYLQSQISIPAFKALHFLLSINFSYSMFHHSFNNYITGIFSVFIPLFLASMCFLMFLFYSPGNIIYLVSQFQYPRHLSCHRLNTIYLNRLTLIFPTCRSFCFPLFWSIFKPLSWHLYTFFIIFIKLIYIAHPGSIP